MGYVEDLFELRTKLSVLFFGDSAAAQNFLQQGRRESGHRSVLFLYVEVGGRLRTKLKGIFSSRLELADGALQNGNLRHRIAGRFQFCANLLFEVGRIPYAIN